MASDEKRKPAIKPDAGFMAVEEALDAMRAARVQQDQEGDDGVVQHGSRAVRTHKSGIHKGT